MQATPQDFIATFGQQEAIELTDPNRQSIQPEKLEIALRHAWGEICTRIGTIYTQAVLLERPCEDLLGIQVRIARWKLDQANTPRQHVLTAYEQEIERLTAIADGKALLLFDDESPGQPSPDPDPDSGNGSATVTRQVLFDAGSPRFGGTGGLYGC
jgi:phage gp36-like protein